MKTRKFLLAATAALTAFVFGLTSCEKDGLTVDPNYVSVYVGETFTVTAKSGSTVLDPSTVTWTSNNTDIFSIENGVITGLAVGQSTFTATYNDQSVTGDVIVSDALPEPPSTADLFEPNGGLVIAVYIPEGTDCNGIAVKSCNLTGNPEVKMEKVEGWDRWYQVRIPGAGEQGTDSYGATYEGVDFAAGNPYQCKVCALPETGFVDTDWTTQWNVKDLEIMEGSAATAEWQDDYGTKNKLSVSESGYVFVNVVAWNSNPCGLSYEGEFTITVNLPECTPADAQIHFVGSPAALGWDDGQIVEIVTDENGAKTATLVVSGKNTDNFKVKLDGKDDWSRQGVYCNKGEVSAYENEPLGSTEEEVYTKTFTVEGWGDNGKAIDGCLTDCAVTPAE